MFYSTNICIQRYFVFAQVCARVCEFKVRQAEFFLFPPVFLTVDFFVL